jgi:hypothetical protein
MGLFSKNKSGYKTFKDTDGKWQSVHKRVAELARSPEIRGLI